MIILETERFYLREMTLSDAKHLFLLNEDPDVTKYTGDNPFLNPTEAYRFFKNTGTMDMQQSLQKLV